MTDRCPEADRLRGEWYAAHGAELKQYYLNLLNMHVTSCPKCKQRMTLFTQAAKTAEMPSLDDKAMEE